MLETVGEMFPEAKYQNTKSPLLPECVLYKVPLPSETIGHNAYGDLCPGKQ